MWQKQDALLHCDKEEITSGSQSSAHKVFLHADQKQLLPIAGNMGKIRSLLLYSKTQTAEVKFSRFLYKSLGCQYVWEQQNPGKMLAGSVVSFTLHYNSDS